MRNKGLIILTILLCVGCREARISDTTFCTFNPELPINLEHPKSAALQEIVDAYLAKGIPGISVLISDDNGIWRTAGGFADIENDIPMKTCHINKLGSVTKMMIGTLLWQFVEDGTIFLDDKIEAYIPEVSSRLAHGSDIEIWMLLNHTSGVYDIAGDLGYNLAVVNDFSRSWTAEEILAFVEGKPATHLPGERIQYSNTNTMLSSMILEAVTGATTKNLLQINIFDKVGMPGTYYYDYKTPFPEDRLAQGYLDFYNNGESIQNISELNPGSGNGYTGVYSTTKDLYAFMKALMVDKSLIQPSNIEAILSTATIAESGNWGTTIGGIHDEYRQYLPEDIHAYGHAGGDIGYSANLSYLPHNNTIFAGCYNYGTNLGTALGDELNAMRGEIYQLLAE